MQYEEYIGLPYKFNGSDENGVDCLGLVRMFYRKHGWIDIDDGLPIDKDTWMKQAPRRIMRFFGKHFDKAREPKDMRPSAVCIMLINGEIHFGIYLGYGRMLQTQLTTEGYEDSYTTIYRRDFWEPWFKIAFNRRDEHGTG